MVRRQDITGLRDGPIEIFHKTLLEREDKLKEINFTRTLAFEKLEYFFEDFEKETMLIVEDEFCEDDNAFLIGFQERVSNVNIYIRYITNLGELEADVRSMQLDDITCISFKTNYTLPYEGYLLEKEVS